MTSAFGRISENVLFSLLIGMFAGWTVVSVAADAGTAAASVESSVACTVAKIAAGIINS
jgi:purine-cytosine permease-like protein